MPELYAKAAAMLAVVADTPSQSARIQFRDAASQVYTIDFPEPLLGGLTMGLIALSNHLRPSGQGQMLNLTSGRVFQIPDGRVGLEVTLEGSMRLPLIFQKEGIAALRKSLDELERLSPSNAGDGKTAH